MNLTYQLGAGEKAEMSKELYWLQYQADRTQSRRHPLRLIIETHKAVIVANQTTCVVRIWCAIHPDLEMNTHEAGQVLVTLCNQTGIGWMTMQ